MKAIELKHILELRDLSGEQIKQLESFDATRIKAFIEVITNNSIKYMDPIIRIIDKKETVTEEQIIAINNAKDEENAMLLAKFLIDKRVQFTDKNRLEMINSVNEADSVEIGQNALRIMWQLSEAGVTRVNEEKYLEIGKVLSSVDNTECMKYIQKFLYELYPRIRFKKTIDEEDEEINNNFELDVVTILANCQTDRLEYVFNTLGGLMYGTKITKDNYYRFVDTLGNASEIGNENIGIILGESANLFSQISEKMQLDYINMLLKSKSFLGANYAYKILKNSQEYLKGDMYDTPELLELIKMVTQLDCCDIDEELDRQLCCDINKNNIGAVLYLVSNRDDFISDIDFMHKILIILNDEDYLSFGELYEVDKVSAIVGLDNLTREFPDLEFSSDKVYVKKSSNHNTDTNEE